MPDLAWASFIRIATNRRIFIVPTPRTKHSASHGPFATSRITYLWCPERHLELFEELCSQAEATGDLTMDAYIAAIAQEHGCSVASIDRDFARFDSVKWIRPGD